MASVMSRRALGLGVRSSFDHIADFQAIFICEARQRSKGVERSIVVDEFHIKSGISLWQRASHFIPGPLLEEEHPDISQFPTLG